MIIGLDMSKKPVRVAGVITLLMCAYNMEREITQLCMLEGVLLGALVRLRGIVDTYANVENKDAEKNDCTMSILRLDCLYFSIG